MSMIFFLAFFLLQKVFTNLLNKKCIIAKPIAPPFYSAEFKMMYYIFAAFEKPVPEATIYSI